MVRVNATLTAVHTVTHPAPGVSKKTITKSENNYMRPNPGSTVTVTVEVRGLGDADTAVVYEPSREVELVLDEEQVSESVGGRVGGRVRRCCMWLSWSWFGVCCST